MNMLAHPEGAPSLKELDYLHPDKGKTTIVEHLDKLIEWGLVDKLVIPKGERSRSLPSTFYRVSDIGREFLDQYGMVPADRHQLQQQYEELPKSEEIRRYEEAPRQGAVADREAVDDYKLAQLRCAVTGKPDQQNFLVSEATPEESGHQRLIHWIMDRVPLLDSGQDEQDRSHERLSQASSDQARRSDEYDQSQDEMNSNSRKEVWH